MKKKIVGLFAALAASALLAGCGEATDVPLNKLKVDKYVTLGRYDSFDISVDTIGVNDDELLQLVNSSYLPYVTAEHGGITDRAVAVGDTVIIDYEGKKDGVAFEGGTAQNASLAIGSGQFIDGFEDGLVGVMPGDTVDLDLTFPEGYDNDELAGQPVVFTVTVNCIQPVELSLEEMEDAVVAGIGLDGVSTVEELRQAAYDYLYSNYEIEVENAIVDQLFERCVFKDNIPEEILQPYRDTWQSFIEAYANYYNVTPDVYTTYFYGASSDKVINENAEKYMKQDLILQAIANREDLNISDEELQSSLQEEADAAGYASVEEYVSPNTMEDYRNDYMNTKVLEFLKERTTINENK